MKKIIFMLFLILIFSDLVLAQSSSLEIIDYEKDILIERGWIRYLSIKVENSGNDYLSNVGISIEGEKSSWFEVQTERTGLDPNKTASFIVKLYVPLDVEKGKYDLFLNANSEEASDRKSFTISIFTSRSEMVLHQIQNFRSSINDLKEETNNAERTGKDVESIRELLTEAESILNAASDDVYNGMYEDATEKIIDAENLVKKAEYELSIATTKPIATSETVSLEWILIIVLLIIILGMFLFFVLSRHEVKMVKKIHVLKPGLNIKKLVVREKKSKKSVDEIEDLEEAESLLEEEYKEGLISRESYEELKSKYEEKILDIKTKKTKK